MAFKKLKKKLSITRNAAGRQQQESPKNSTKAEIAWSPPSPIRVDTSFKSLKSSCKSLKSSNHTTEKYLPTREELEQAAFTLMKAQQHQVGGALCQDIFDELKASSNRKFDSVSQHKHPQSCRKPYSDEAAARKLQAIVRGYLARRKVDKLIEALIQDLMQKAEEEERRKEEQAAAAKEKRRRFQADVKKKQEAEEIRRKAQEEKRLREEKANELSKKKEAEDQRQKLEDEERQKFMVQSPKCSTPKFSNRKGKSNSNGCGTHLFDKKAEVKILNSAEDDMLAASIYGGIKKPKRKKSKKPKKKTSGYNFDAIIGDDSSTSSTCKMSDSLHSLL